MSKGAENETQGVMSFIKARWKPGDDRRCLFQTGASGGPFANPCNPRIRRMHMLTPLYGLPFLHNHHPPDLLPTTTLRLLPSLLVPHPSSSLLTSSGPFRNRCFPELGTHLHTVVSNRHS